MNNLSKFSLVVSNFIPILGVILWKWDISLIILLYWSENLIIGFFNLIKIWRSEGQFNLNGNNFKFFVNGIYSGVLKNKLKFVIIIFFMIHYGLFTFAQGIFVFSVFKLNHVLYTSLFISFVSIFISHLISYKTNFINNGEYLRASPDMLFFQPYRRVIVMQFTVIFGGFFINIIGQPIGALLIMIIVKILLDLKAHDKEHIRFRNFQIIK